MLYDKRWDAKVETKADPFTLESLIAWLEKQPPKEEYNYNCNGACMLAQYFRAMGFSFASAGSLAWHYLDDMGRSVESFLPSVFNDIAVSRISRFGYQEEPFTFGAALSRARDVLAKRA